MKPRLIFILGLFALALALPAAGQAVVVSDVEGLVNAVNAANAGGDKEIILQDGTYTLSNMLWVEADGLTVRSESGDRQAVIIQGQGMDGGVSHVFNVAGDNFTAQDMTLRSVANHAIQLQPGADSPTMRNLVFQDTFEQMLKVAWDSNNPDEHSDGGLVEGCHFSYSAGIGPQYYIGGIDCHRGENWIIRSNTFVNIKSPSDSLAEHAVHFWSNAVGTLVERNLIINCDRGVGFGLGDRGHVGGVIRNNMIYHDSNAGFGDVGISIENASGAMVYNNTIYYEFDYPNAIEYRFSGTTGALIANNLTNRAITSRDGGSATATHNVTDAQGGWFRNAGGGDLHLASEVPQVVDQGTNVDGLTNDFDGNARPHGPAMDIGAHEYGASAPTPGPEPSPGNYNTGPPASTVKLIFIHHSCGENWLGDGSGGLGAALRDNNYFVSDTNYGWGPDSVGDMTDIGLWWYWYRGENSGTYTAALYAESSQNSSYSRLGSDPGGENQVIMFKSCYPNSSLSGNPGDAPTTGDNPMRGEWVGSDTYTVANAKGVYNDLLEYFATRQDKLFVLITPPPQVSGDTDSGRAANARAVNTWLVNEWLANYPHRNVAVWDFYNVLTSNGGNEGVNDAGQEGGNHHRIWNGGLQYIKAHDQNVSAYPSAPDDSHPTYAGNNKATSEYVPLLNVYYHCWKGSGGCPPYGQGGRN